MMAMPGSAGYFSVGVSYVETPTDPMHANFNVFLYENPTSAISQNMFIATGTANPSIVTIIGGPQQFNVAVSGMTQSGTVILSIPHDNIISDQSNMNAEGSAMTNYILPTAQVPEFPTVALPVIAVIGLVFFIPEKKS